MITYVLALIRIWIDIIRLRKGPDAIPQSTVVLAVAVALWLGGSILLVLAFDEFDLKGFIIVVLTSVIGLICYAAILNLFGRANRLLQTLSAIIGCGALLTIAFAVGKFLISLLGGAGFSGNVVFLVVLWSVLVEGHIISRAIDRPFLLGFVFALAVLFLQLYVDMVVNPLENS